MKAVRGDVLVLDEGREYFFEEGCYILEHLNTETDPALSIARARVPVGTTTRRHALRGVRERYLILSGSGAAEIGDSPEAVVGPGDVVVIPAGCPQRIRNTGAVDLVFLAICTPRFEPACYQRLE